MRVERGLGGGTVEGGAFAFVEVYFIAESEDLVVCGLA